MHLLINVMDLTCRCFLGAWIDKLYCFVHVFLLDFSTRMRYTNFKLLVNEDANCVAMETSYANVD